MQKFLKFHYTIFNSINNRLCFSTCGAILHRFQFHENLLNYSNKRTLMSSNLNFGIFKSSGPSNNDESIIQRVRNKFGFTEQPKTVLLASGYYWYIKVADEINYKEFFKVCEMEDTFSSWFYVMELHMWMLAARFMEENEQGRMIRNSMLKAMWADIDVRSKKLEGALSSARKSQISELNNQFQAALISYDEGYLGNDKILAGALWRRFLREKHPNNEEEVLKQIIALEMLVIYVRHQMYQLNKMNKDELFLKRQIKWTPFTKDIFNLIDKKENIK